VEHVVLNALEKQMRPWRLILGPSAIAFAIVFGRSRSTCIECVDLIAFARTNIRDEFCRRRLRDGR
jgi:hypothetical protein